MNQDRPRWSLLYFVTATCLFIYLCLRAWYVPPVHDEVASFFIYVQTGDFLPWEAFFDANNHLLNSALSSFFYRVLGDHIFVLRLASLLFFPLYAFYIYRIGVLFFRSFELLFFAFGMLFLHNFIEYFGFCRGYGMGLACCVALLYYLFAYMRYHKGRDLVFFSLFVFLSLLANLNLLPLALMATGYLLIHLLIQRQGVLRLILFLLWNFAWLGLAAWYGSELQRSGALYYGGKNGLVPNTVQSLSTLLFDSRGQFFVYLFMVPAFVSLILLPFVFLKKKLRHFFTDPVWAMQSLFWGSVIVIPVMHVVLDTNYPEDRTALHLGVLMLLNFFIVLKASGLAEKIRPFIMGICSFLLVILFALQVNLQYSAFWKGDHIPYSFFKRTQKNIQAHETYVNGYFLSELIWAYYNYRSADQANSLHMIDYLEQQGDYMVVGDSVYNDSVARIYKVAEHDRVLGKMLLERREKTQLIPLDTFFVPDCNNCQEMYTNMAAYRDTSVANLDLCFEFSCNFKTGQKPIIEILLKTENHDGGPDKGMRVNLNWLSDHVPEEGYTLHHRMYAPNLQKENRNVLVFVFNPREQQFSFSNMKVVVYQVKYP